MLKFTAAHRFPYDGKVFNAGDEVIAQSQKDADLLLAIGHVRHLTRSFQAGSEKHKGTRQQSPVLFTKGH